MTESKKQNIILAIVKPFLIGSLSGSIASCIIQPIDTVKVLIQLKKEEAGFKKVNVSPFYVVTQTISERGFLALYRGIDAAVMRQFIYCGVRLGLYKMIEDEIKYKSKRNLTFTQKLGTSLFTGALGSFIANPTDVSLIRFQADNNLPPEKRRNYKNIFNALYRIAKQQGVSGLWRGSTPTVFRAMAVNSSQLVSYNSTKQRLLTFFQQKEQSIKTRLISSAISGISITIISLPFDNLKTKLMKMAKNSQGIFPYSGFFDCFRKSIKNEGLYALWVGMGTYYTRIAPHAMITVLAQDFFHDLYNKYENH